MYLLTNKKKRSIQSGGTLSKKRFVLKSLRFQLLLDPDNDKRKYP
jgi:hypothetical protein